MLNKELIQALNKKATTMNYPGNQAFDAMTFRPSNTETRLRVSLLEKNAPEIYEGGNAFLDVGSNKGFMAFHLRNHYKRLYCYEPIPEYHQFCFDLARAHDIDNIKAIHGTFRDVPCCRLNYGLKYDVVYLGSVGHHLYRDAVRHRAPRWLWLAKAAALTKKYLIVDGPLTMENGSLKTFARDEGWSPEVVADYTADSHVEYLKGEFELVRIQPNEKCNRECAVFKRIKPSLPARSYEAAVLAREDGKDTLILKGNKARPADSIWKRGHLRYKVDPGHQPEQLLSILNRLPEHVAPTVAMLVDLDGKVRGDVAEWADGSSMQTEEEAWLPWLTLNRKLTSVGVIESHFKPTDFKWERSPKDGNLLDVDVDMVVDLTTARSPEWGDYLPKWRKGRIGNLDKEWPNECDYLRDHFTEIDCFDILERRVCAKLGRELPK